MSVADGDQVMAGLKSLFGSQQAPDETKELRRTAKSGGLAALVEEESESTASDDTAQPPRQDEEVPSGTAAASSSTPTGMRRPELPVRTQPPAVRTPKRKTSLSIPLSLRRR